MFITTHQIITYILVFFACSFVWGLLSGCSAYSEVKAPCNYEGAGCGTKIAINSLYDGRKNHV
ncbi:MAG: hypothetical protein K0S27_1676 [Gammaproteobacteria bacterium]|jgi:hypothetical protein|nr:hypothetical protein [Gammaproteobacteria bacterium]